MIDIWHGCSLIGINIVCALIRITVSNQYINYIIHSVIAVLFLMNM